MAKRDEIVKFINGYLKIDKIEDRSANGLQVAGKEEVKKIVLGVSASLALFEEAVKKGADMIIVHHGLLWEESDRRIDDLTKKRLQTLFEKNISLLGYHLPLDSHPVIGNNAQILKKLKLKKKRKLDVGFVGELKQKMSFKDFAKKVNGALGSQSFVLNFGPKMIKTVGVVSGGAGGSRHIIKAFQHDCDAYITGIPFESGYQMAREGKLNVIGPGHYNTEKFGVQELGKLLEKKFKVKTEFIDIPNPL